MNVTSSGAMKLATLALVVGGALLGGCVNEDRWNAVREANRELEAQNKQLSDTVRQERELQEQLRRNASAAQQQADALRAQNEQQAAELARLKGEIDAMDQKLRGMDFGGLDARTDAALQELAARHANLLTYDSKQGVLRFASDVTFASGSFDLVSEAKNAIAELARILKETPEAQGYDIKVVGHTDTQPVRAVAGRPFRNNVELSSFRAISVRNEMVNTNGVGPEKVEFAGFGEFRPLVDNNASGNTPANRRVEIYLRPSTFSGLKANPIVRPAGAAAARPAGTGATPARPEPVQPARPRPTPDIMK